MAQKTKRKRLIEMATILECSSLHKRLADWPQQEDEEDSMNELKRTRRRKLKKFQQQQQHKEMFSKKFCYSRNTILLVIILSVILSFQRVSSSAVVRPTIFSDLSPGQQQAQQQQPATPNQADQTTSGSSNDKQRDSIQASQMQAAQVQSQQHQPTHFAPNVITQHAHNPTHWGQQADGPSATSSNKINPLKSRFCHAGPNAPPRALGLQSFELDDFSLSASSFSNEKVRPHLARLKHDLLGGAWCPGKPMSSHNSGTEWLQVRLNRSHVITAIETQGRFALGSGKEFVPFYQVEYSRDGGLTWHRWKDIRGFSTIRANDDVNTPVRNELSPPIVGANVIKILPHSQHLRTVCLRLELHGCTYDEGAPIAYETSDGVVEPRWGHLIDYTYDGIRSRAPIPAAAGQPPSVHLSSGLGQLVDGVRGQDDFSLNNGFEWVGWKSMNGDVEIEFTFKTLRNFTGALFHSNNLFSSGVEVFQGVDVYYGIDVQAAGDALRDQLWERERRQLPFSSAMSQIRGPKNARPIRDQQQQTSTLWSRDVLSIEYEPDKKLEASRPVTVHLKQRLANKLRFVLKFASKWILVSEVEFLSHPVDFMSLSSLSEHFTPQLLQALEPAKSYDEYMAVLREHQLRRIATDAIFGIGPDAMLSSSTSSSISDLSTSTDLPEDQQRDQTGQGKLISGPTIPVGSGAGVFMDQQQPEQPIMPSTNPVLSRLPTNNNQQQPTIADISFGIVESNNFHQQRHQQPELNGFGSTTSSNIGITTSIALACVVCLLLVGALFVLSSYRLRSNHRHAPAAALSHHHHHFGHHFGHGGSASSGSTNATTKNLMSDVFSNAPASSTYDPAVTDAGSSNYANHETSQPSQPSRPMADSASSSSNSSTASGSHYNPLFAIHSNSTSASFRHNNAGSATGARRGGPLSSLRQKLVKTLSGGQNNSATLASRHHQPLFAVQQTPAAHQLLVSLKDSIATTNVKPNQFNVGQQQNQLIVGLNQANPLAQQQIYSSASSSNGQQYALFNSYGQASDVYMATSGDYATPDLAVGVTRFGQNRFSAPTQHEQQLQQINRTMISNPLAQENLIQFRQQQQQQQQNHEHNYEFIQDEHPQQQQQQQQQVMANANTRTLMSNMHQRRLSNQQCAANNNQSSFNSMTLHGGNALKQTRTTLSNDIQQVRLNTRTEPASNDTNNHYYYADTQVAGQLINTCRK